jgi:MFS family permease
MIIYILFVADFHQYDNKKKKDHQDVKEWRQLDVLKSKEFFLLAPGSFIVTFLTTGLILYQLPLAESKGWTAEWMAFCLTGFAAARIISSLASGTIVDKLGAKILFALHLLPFIIALIILYFYSGEWAAYLYMFLTGITVGLGSIVKSALQAEIFGVKSIGAVRSLFSTLTVLSTALGPILFGFLLDKGVAFSNIIVLSALLSIGVTAWNFRLGYSYHKSLLSN